MPKSNKLPPISECLKLRKPKTSEEPWVYLEREMIEMAQKGIKPYNETVGQWLLFLKDLKEHYRQERQRMLEQIKNQVVGPPWLCLLTPIQESVIPNLKTALRFDNYYNTCINSYGVLRKMGVTANIPATTMMAAIKESGEDPGIFLWALFTLYYKQQPSEPLPKYSRSAKTLLTGIVFIDFKQCLKNLCDLTDQLVYPPKPPPKKQKENYTPDIKFGPYLQKMYSRIPWAIDENSNNPKPYLKYKVKSRTDEEYEEFAQRTVQITMIARRRNVFFKESIEERKCNYKFWSPPQTFRADDSKMAELILLTNMLKLKPKASHLKHVREENYSCYIGTITYSGGHPHYLVHNYMTLQTPYIIHNGGCAKVGNEYITNILGSYEFPRENCNACVRCDCMKKWDINRITESLAQARCLCGHRYDFHNPGKPNPLQLFFRPPTREYPYYTLDLAMIYDTNSRTEFIKQIVEDALQSETPSATLSLPFVNPAALPTNVLLKSFFGDLMESSLLIPHLPKAYLLPNIQAWVRKRIKGPIGPKLKKKLQIKSVRAWDNINSLSFRAPAHNIPFTSEQLQEFTFEHRNYLKKLKEEELKIFIKKNNRLQTMESELLWATFRPYDFASKNFIDTFVAYMHLPGQSTYYINPYKSDFC